MTGPAAVKNAFRACLGVPALDGLNPAPRRRLVVLPGEVKDAAGGWVASECGVPAVMIVGVQPGVKGGAPFGF
jgi:hypothetical protein